MENRTRKRQIWKTEKQKTINSCWVASQQRVYKNNKWQKKSIFLIIDSGSTEQQVLHIKYVKFHQKTAVLQHNVQKRLRKGVQLTNNKLTIRQPNTKHLNKVSQTKYENSPPVFGMKSTSLTRHKNRCQWVNVRAPHAERISHVVMKENKQNVERKARFRQEKTAISNMHSIGNRTYR